MQKSSLFEKCMSKNMVLKCYSLKKYEQQIGANVCADSVDEIQVS